VHGAGTKAYFSGDQGPLKNGEGKTIGLFGIAHDITERRRADADLHFVLHEAGDAIWIIDANGNFLYANPSACRLTGHNIDDLKQLHYEDLLPSEDRGQLPEHFSRLYEQKYVRHEWQLLRKDRQVITVELTTARLQDGRFMAFGRDRSEQKRAELALKEREQRLARVIEGSDQGYWEWDLRSNDFTVSARWEQMLGYEPGEMDVRFEKWGELVQRMIWPTPWPQSGVICKGIPATRGRNTLPGQKWRVALDPLQGTGGGVGQERKSVNHVRHPYRYYRAQAAGNRPAGGGRSL